MKTSRLLVTLLLVTLCTGFYSCEKDLDKEIYSIGGVDETFSQYGITDYKDIEMRSCSGIDDNTSYYRWGQANFAGLRKNHLWIASFDRESKQKLAEWTDTKEFNRTRRVNLGYGEYKDVTISGIALCQTYSKANSFVALVQLYGDDYRENLHIFKTPTSVKELKGLNDYIYGWYKESIAIGKCCYTMAGDTIFVAKKGFSYNEGLYLANQISYREDICAYKDIKAFYIAKRNHELGENTWRVEVIELSNEPANAKVTVSIIDNSTKIWKYKADIIHYDGTKKNYTFAINIETGVLIGDEQPITLANLKGSWDMTKCYGWEYNDKGVKEDWEEDVKGEYIFFEDVDGNGGYNDGYKTYYFASSINGDKLVLRNSDWLEGKDVTITKLTSTELHITATDKVSEENYEMKRR